MTSRNDILQSIRRKQPAPAELPSLTGDWIRFDDPLLQFQQLLESVGGKFVAVASLDEAASTLAANPAFTAAKQIVSAYPQIQATVDLDAIDDPHALETVDWAILPAQFAVAENGALWVTDAGVRHRAIYFIAQHLALVFPVDEMVHNMHEAYARLQADATNFGVFISGPSKTADIEQSLVIGAHGPRSLTVFGLRK